MIPGRKYILRSEKPLLKCLLQDSLVVDLNNTYPTELLKSLNKYFVGFVFISEKSRALESDRPGFKSRLCWLLGNLGQVA